MTVARAFGLPRIDVATGETRTTHHIDGSRKTAIAMRPDGRELAIGNTNGLVYLVDPSSAKLRRVWVAHLGAVMGLEYSPDGTRLASGGLADNRAKLWDAASGALLRTYDIGGGVVTTSFSADGTWLATAGFDYTARVWDLASGELLREVDGAFAARFAPDGTELLVAGKPGHAAIRDVALDHRPVEELAALVARHAPWALVDGRLVLQPRR